ncbi:MAG TPA: hypothetical protein G4N95_01355 [Anaerolineae bacterium]|nr:hypothetical protein [Anaerolineae bacterium]
MDDKPKQKNEKSWDEIRQELIREYEYSKRELNEISMMLEQSQVDVNRLSQRNETASTRLKQIFGHFESIPREDIRETYDAALDAQQRLFVMRGQMEKLQSDKERLERNISSLQKVLEALEGDLPTPKKESKKEAFDIIEAVIQAQESERQRLSRQMHDGPAQALSNFILQTEIAMRLFDIDQEKAKKELISLKKSASTTFQQVRDFIFELRPMMLDDLGLGPTLKRYFQAFESQFDAELKLNITGDDRRLENYIEVIIFRAIQELLGNAVKNCKARQVKVQLDVTDTIVRTTVDDNGQGYDPDEAMKTGMGLRAIRDRLEMIGGRINIDSDKEKGTHVQIEIPIKKEKGEKELSLL